MSDIDQTHLLLGIDIGLSAGCYFAILMLFFIRRK